MDLTKPVQTGTICWAIKRTFDDGQAYCVQSYMFLAEIQGYAIMLPYAGLQSGVNMIETLAFKADETRKNLGKTNIGVFPMEDCFLTYKDACKALNKEIFK